MYLCPWRQQAWYQKSIGLCDANSAFRSIRSAQRIQGGQRRAQDTLRPHHKRVRKKVICNTYNDIRMCQSKQNNIKGNEHQHDALHVARRVCIHASPDSKETDTGERDATWDMRAVGEHITKSPLPRGAQLVEPFVSTKNMKSSVTTTMNNTPRSAPSSSSCFPAAAAIQEEIASILDGHPGQAYLSHTL